MAGYAMREVWWDIVWTLAGLTATIAGLAIGAPSWLMAIGGFTIGAGAILALTDYRDEIRRRDGLLQRDMGWEES
jgi:hypothetical protein